jgi:DNA polymerase (family X)
MDARTAALVLTEIATLRQLRGDPDETTTAFDVAARLLTSAGPAAITTPDSVTDLTVRTVIADLAATGDSRLLDDLREDTPEGLQELLRVPGLGPVTIHRAHAGLGIETLQALEDAVRDGRLEALPRFGPKLVERVRKGIAQLRAADAPVLMHHADGDAARLAAAVQAQPGVTHVHISGALRRRQETVSELTLVVECSAPPAAVAAQLAHLRGVKSVVGGGTRVITLRFEDATTATVHCVHPSQAPVTLLRTTGHAAHVRQVLERLAATGLRVVDDEVRDRTDTVVPIADEAALYHAAGLAYIPPALREDLGEVDAAARHTLPTLIQTADIRGILHCHSGFSDGHGSIAELAEAAIARGWSYLGVSDHSRSAQNAGGMDTGEIERQHDEIDAVNAHYTGRVRVLKGVEADILPDGTVDFGTPTLDRFDYVIASVHTRFGMNGAQMTDRVCAALEDPHVTILGHPTGRLLLTREPFAIDLPTVLAHAARLGVAVELNADPHRMDLDWRWCHAARDAGALVEIAPDAHSVAGLDNVIPGVQMAQKGWLEARHVLNTRSADDILAFARARRTHAHA